MSNLLPNIVVVDVEKQPKGSVIFKFFINNLTQVINVHDFVFF